MPTTGSSTVPEVRIAGAGDAGNVAKQLRDFNAEFGTPSPPVAELEHGAIMELAIAECIARGCEEMHINVDEPDEGARRFYERLGFSNFEVGEDYRMLCYIRER